MTLPSGPEYIVPILLELERRGGSSQPEEIYDAVVDHFPPVPPGDITRSDLDIENNSGGAKYKKDILGTGDKLKGRSTGVECIEMAPRVHGTWVLTAVGRSELRRLLMETHSVPAIQVDTAIGGSRKLCQIDGSWVPKPGRTVDRRRRRRY